MTMSTPTPVQQYASLEAFTHPDEMSYQSRPIRGRRDLARWHACPPSPVTPRLLVDKPALSIRQPWVWAILWAGKDVENRSWSTGYRGDLLIHAGTRLDRVAIVEAQRAGVTVPDPLPTGGILGRVRVVDVHHAHDCDTGDDEQGHGPYCSPWAEPGQYHWVLGDRLPLAHLQPCRGRLGLWTPFPTATEGQAS